MVTWQIESWWLESLVVSGEASWKLIGNLEYRKISRKLTWLAGKSPFLIGYTSSNGCFLIVILVFGGGNTWALVKRACIDPHAPYLQSFGEVVNKMMRSFVGSSVCYFLSNLHPFEHKIFLARHGESHATASLSGWSKLQDHLRRHIWDNDVVDIRPKKYPN